MTENYWKKLSTVVLLDHPRIKVVEDTLLLPEGEETQYIRYEGLQDYVTVIPQEAGKIALIKEYSYPHDEWLLQFPEGSIESAEEAKESARRELEEEAGIVGEKWFLLGTNYSHHRRSNEKNFIFLAQGLREVPHEFGDKEEFGTETHWFTIEEVNEMVRNGQIVQKNALAAWALFLLHQDRKTA